MEAKKYAQIARDGLFANVFRLSDARQFSVFSLLTCLRGALKGV